MNQEKSDWLKSVSPFPLNRPEYNGPCPNCNESNKDMVRTHKYWRNEDKGWFECRVVCHNCKMVTYLYSSTIIRIDKKTDKWAYEWSRLDNGAHDTTITNYVEFIRKDRERSVTMFKSFSENLNQGENKI